MSTALTRWRVPGAGRSLERSLVLAAALAGAALAACESPPPLKISYELSQGPAQNCKVDSCDGVQIYCAPVLSIRVVDPLIPFDPAKPERDNALLSVCKSFEATSLCGMHQVHLPADAELPARRLAIQVALYDANDIKNEAGEIVCPKDLRFDANNFAIASAPYPAVAGQGYFSPGDDETIVKLGCGDLTLLSKPSCRGSNILPVSASIDDFDSGVGLPPHLAEKMEVYVGEPSSYFDPSSENQYHRLPLNQIVKLQPLAGSVPAWRVELGNPPAKSVCLAVREYGSQTTSSVSCRLYDKESTLDLRGVYMKSETLATVLAALQLSAFPTKGLVVGMVVDSLGKPLKDVQVRPSSGSVKYLSEGRDHISGTSTSSNGIFMSLDTPYTTSWSAPGTTGGYGGIIDDHVTVIILQPDAQTQERARAQRSEAARSEATSSTKLPTLQLQFGG